METLVSRIKEIGSAKGFNLNGIEAGAGIGMNTIYKWDKSSPSADNLQKVATFLGVSVDFILGREMEDMDDVMAIREQLRRRPEMKMLFDASKKATPEQILAVAEMIKTWAK